MPFEILQEDLTKLPVDAIVNPTDSRYSGSGGVDRAVHQAAGPGLFEARPLSGAPEREYSR